MKTKLNTPKLTATKGNAAKQVKTRKALTIIDAEKKQSNDGAKMRVTFKQLGLTKNGEALSSAVTFETANVDNVAGQALGHLYKIVSNYKKSNSKLFNFAYPIYLVIEREGQIINFEDMLNNEYIGLTKGLKIQWTREGLLRFGAKVRIAINAVSECRMNIIRDEFEGIEF